MTSTKVIETPRFLNGTNYLQEMDTTANGLYFQDIYLPEEVVRYILSFVDPRKLLKFSKVCRKWNKLIKSDSLWLIIYKRKYGNEVKKFPWYLYYCHLTTNYFDTNLIKNGNGQYKFKHWKILEKGGWGFAIENPPKHADHLPLNVPEFNNKTSCFATSSFTCHKMQVVKLGKNKLFQFIVKNYKPHIYLSEWVTNRYDSDCVYRLYCGFEKTEKIINVKAVVTTIQPYLGITGWRKIDFTVVDYPDDFDNLVFGHLGNDLQTYKGYYGSKMTGGVLKFLFNSIEELPINEKGNTLPKLFSQNNYVSSNGFQATLCVDKLPNNIWEDFEVNEDYV